MLASIGVGSKGPAGEARIHDGVPDRTINQQTVSAGMNEWSPPAGPRRAVQLCVEACSIQIDQVRAESGRGGLNNAPAGA